MSTLDMALLSILLIVGLIGIESPGKGNTQTGDTVGAVRAYWALTGCPGSVREASLKKLEQPFY